MPNRFFQVPTTIDPLHVAQALCDWISHRSAALEAPDVLTDAGWKNKTEPSNAFLADDSRSHRSLRRSSLQGVGLALFATAVVGGCSQPQLPVYPVVGQVVFEGDWPNGAQVVLHPLANDLNVRPRGEVDPLGSFQLSTYAHGDGAPAGEYIVTLTWQPYVIDGEDYKPGPNVLPEMYANPATSPLIIEVTEGVNQLPPYVLSKCDEKAALTSLTPDF